VASAYGWVTILLYCLWLNENIYYFLMEEHFNKSIMNELSDEVYVQLDVFVALILS
jgi:hypothetical protein